MKWLIFINLYFTEQINQEYIFIYNYSIAIGKRPPCGNEGWD